MARDFALIIIPEGDVTMHAVLDLQSRNFPRFSLFNYTHPCFWPALERSQGNCRNLAFLLFEGIFQLAFYYSEFHFITFRPPNAFICNTMIINSLDVFIIDMTIQLIFARHYG